MPATDAPPAEVEARDLQRDLDAYLARVRDGEALTITQDGEPGGHLLPAPSQTARERELYEKMRKLQEAGVIAWNGKKFDPQPLPIQMKGGKTPSDIVLANRNQDVWPHASTSTPASWSKPTCRMNREQPSRRRPVGQPPSQRRRW